LKADCRFQSRHHCAKRDIPSLLTNDTVYRDAAPLLERFY